MLGWREIFNVFVEPGFYEPWLFSEFCLIVLSPYLLLQVARLVFLLVRVISLRFCCLG
jgi:hypothetical protein